MPKAQTPYSFSENETYVLVGGLGGLGQSIARWMFSRRARHLIIISRGGASTEAAQKLVKELSNQGCEIKAIACDVSDKVVLEQTIADCQKDMPPIKGCIQGAMQLKVCPCPACLFSILFSRPLLIVLTE